MNVEKRTIALISLEPRTVLEAPLGLTTSYDAAKGSLQAEQIIVNGILRIHSSDASVKEAALETRRLSGNGTIVCAMPERPRRD